MESLRQFYISSQASGSKVSVLLENCDVDTHNPFRENLLGMCHTKMACSLSIIPAQTITPLVLFRMAVPPNKQQMKKLANPDVPCAVTLTSTVVSRVLASLWTPDSWDGREAKLG